MNTAHSSTIALSLLESREDFSSLPESAQVRRLAILGLRDRISRAQQFAHQARLNAEHWEREAIRYTAQLESLEGQTRQARLVP